MKIEIEIPKEFECDYNNNKFECFFKRVLAGTDWDGEFCGNYEEEIAEMFVKAFKNSTEKK